MALRDENVDEFRTLIEQLKILQETADRLLREMQDINSARPATREFLQARGLTNVRELDAAGQKELREYLQNKLRLATN